jgi:hypothetical protein
MDNAPYHKGARATSIPQEDAPAAQVTENNDTKLPFHGILGQTIAYRVFASKWQFLKGELDDYKVQSEDIFGNDFTFNQFV